MTDRSFSFSPDLSLPITATTQKFAFLGTSGGGKTYGAGKFTEGLLELGAQVVVIDTVGNWWGLRLAADGKHAGVAIPVLGGERGDVALEPEHGKLAAETVAETKASPRDLYIQVLVRAELVAVAGDRIVATPEGIQVLGDSFRPLPTGEELRAHWLGELDAGERKVFEVIVAAYPEEVTRQAISDATGYTKSTRDLYVQRLQRRELADATGPGVVRASAELFS